MSLPLLALAAQAASTCDAGPEDEEFGLTLAELGEPEVVYARWGLYRSDGAGVVLGIIEAWHDIARRCLVCGGRACDVVCIERRHHSGPHIGPRWERQGRVGSVAVAVAVHHEAPSPFMPPGPSAPLTARPYCCERCDVAGLGARCWCCGTRDVRPTTSVMAPDGGTHTVQHDDDRRTS